MNLDSHQDAHANYDDAAAHDGLDQAYVPLSDQDALQAEDLNVEPLNQPAYDAD